MLYADDILLIDEKDKEMWNGNKQKKILYSSQQNIEFTFYPQKHRATKVQNIHATDHIYSHTGCKPDN